MAHSSLKVAIRADRPAGVIRAFLANLDGSDAFELGTLSIRIADENKATFDAWVSFWEMAVQGMLGNIGVDVKHWQRFKGSDKN